MPFDVSNCELALEDEELSGFSTSGVVGIKAQKWYVPANLPVKSSG